MTLHLPPSAFDFYVPTPHTTVLPSCWFKNPFKAFFGKGAGKGLSQRISDWSDECSHGDQPDTGLHSSFTTHNLSSCSPRAEAKTKTHVQCSLLANVIHSRAGRKGSRKEENPGQESSHCCGWLVTSHKTL